MFLKELYSMFGKSKEFSMFCYLLCNSDADGNVTDIPMSIFSDERTSPTIHALVDKGFVVMADDTLKICQIQKYDELMYGKKKNVLRVKPKGEEIATKQGVEYVDWDELLQYFNNRMKGRGIPQIKDMSEKRKGLVRGRIKDYGVASVKIVIDNASESDFMNGYVSGTAYGFDWMFRPNNFIKVLEGNYKNRKMQTEKERKQYETERDLQSSANYLDRLSARRQATKA